MTQTESVGGVQDKTVEVSDRGKNSGLNGVDGGPGRNAVSQTHIHVLHVRNLPFTNIVILANCPGFKFTDSVFTQVKIVPLYLESTAFNVTMDTSGHFDSRRIMKFPITFTSSKELVLVYTFVPIRLLLNSSIVVSSHCRRDTAMNTKR